MKPEIFQLGQLAITVQSVKAALEFYRDVLGLKFLFAPGENLAFLQCGETRIMLTTPQGSGAVGRNSIPYFKVRNIEAYFKETKLKGASIEREPAFTAKLEDHELWIGFLKDPDGNLIGIMEEKSLS